MNDGYLLQYIQSRSIIHCSRSVNSQYDVVTDHKKNSMLISFFGSVLVEKLVERGKYVGLTVADKEAR